ncbi:MAG TPA: WXG100 family type VII secretion target [Pseudonocardiaceae bacterium]|jgi:uncharacterized protein YukE|nr:WXG100 family type VII secretion target [Pseudonocardiaceae bacterium]
MTSGFSADPAQLRQHGGEFAGHADRTGAIHTELTGALAATGTCWGEDAAGQSFAAGYLQPAQDTLAKLGSLPAGLADVGDRFTATATRYEQVDQQNAAGLRAQD